MKQITSTLNNVTKGKTGTRNKKHIEKCKKWQLSLPAKNFYQFTSTFELEFGSSPSTEAAH
jgi:hypothetical protein